MKPPKVSTDLMEVQLCTLPMLSRTLVASLEHAGFFTPADCLDRWTILASCAGTWRTRHSLAPPNIGRSYVKQLVAALEHYSRCGVPEVNRRDDEPTPEEIRERCAAIRAGWDAMRWREYASDRVKVPVVQVPFELRPYV